MISEREGEEGGIKGEREKHFVRSGSGLFIFIIIFASLGQAMTTVAVHVDSKAELTTLLEQWEKEHGSGQDMVPLLTRYEQSVF